MTIWTGECEVMGTRAEFPAAGPTGDARYTISEGFWGGMSRPGKREKGTAWTEVWRKVWP